MGDGKERAGDLAHETARQERFAYLWTMRFIMLTMMGGLAACGSDPAGPLTADDTVPPSILTVAPADDATDVPLRTEVSVTFSEVVNLATVAEESFFVTTDGDRIPGSHRQDGPIVLFAPDSALDSLTIYVATVTQAVRDPAGNPLGQARVWVFTTGTQAAP